ncbi:hypothetical protein [Chryseobacterium sp. PMSZPI]|uniref:hypothetical protein n=1 Tax=Chryseobacterium sp. PMSZPI TaxID=1033900 RepID=UPI000C31EC40|nr:hypothetical protein [Chryseobacterium sp. PMSZPI]PKF74224.1 hypothetical protein CW752_09865 [Chryseobacterium sp. PMSZPI]
MNQILIEKNQLAGGLESLAALTEFKENIIPYIGEAAPYVFVPENIIIHNDHKIETEITDCDFKNENFIDLLKILTSFGTSNLYRILQDTSKKKIYFLAEKLRAVKLSYSEIPHSISVTCESILESKRKGKSFFNVKNLITQEILYSYEADYHIIEKSAFENLYEHLFNDTIIEHYGDVLPETMIDVEDDQRFRILIEPFTLNQCKGHFESYPIVSVAFTAKSILKGIFDFLGKNSLYELDSISIYQTKIMPPGKELIIHVSRYKFLKNLTHFKCEVKDACGEIYGTYIISMKSKALSQA